MFIAIRFVRFASSFAVLALPLAFTACSRKDAPPSEASPAAAASATSAAPLQVHDAAHPLEISVTSDGFVPARAKVKVGEPVTLVVTRKVARTCATDIVIKDYGINKPLPEGERVSVTITPQKPGPIRYACAMDMVSGELVAE
jgi:plastocyanin